MATTVPGLELHLEAALQRQAEIICADSGVPLPDLISKFIRRVVTDGHLPSYLFEPNQTTIEAMEATRRGEVTRVKNLDDLLAQLHADD